MSWFNKRVERLVESTGYRLIKTAKGSNSSPEMTKVGMENFASLATAYEQLLNEHHGGELITPNHLRPLLLTRLLGTPPAEAYHIVEALAVTRDIGGDVCEFGIAQGETSALIANEIRGTGKTLHLFDSFQGLSEPTEEDQLKDDIFSLGSIEAYAGTMAYSPEKVRSRLAAIDFPESRFVIHPGFIDVTFGTGIESLPDEVSFAYIDFDLYEPIMIALEYLGHHLSPGGIVIVDDYDHFSTGAKSAVDQFVLEHAEDDTRFTIRIPDRHYGAFAILSMTSG